MPNTQTATVTVRFDSLSQAAAAMHALPLGCVAYDDIYFGILKHYCPFEEGDLVCHADSATEGYVEDHPTGRAAIGITDIWVTEAGLLHMRLENYDETLEDVIINDEWVRLERDETKRGRYLVQDRRSLPRS